MKIIKTENNEINIFAESFEDEAYEQVKKLAEYEAYQEAKIRIMPDAHAGKGCTVGTTMTITDKVTPNLVGVDIGCGMLTIELQNKNINYAGLDKVIRHKIPSGANIHNSRKAKFDFSNLLCHKHVDMKRASLSIGTLGGGNHFIEVDYSEKDDKYYLVIHSGSRKLGSDVCQYYQKLAFLELSNPKLSADILPAGTPAGKGKKRNLYAELRKLKKSTADKDLAHLTGDSFNAYMNDMSVVQQFASLNRKVIADIICGEMGFTELSRFETIHNYIDFKRMILRKGAVSAEAGEKLIIPINMRDGALICTGKGNEDWNYSAPHGAGRLMSRSKAKEKITFEEFENSMANIYTSSVSKATIDEAPQAYKPISEIKRMIVDTVDILDVVKPVYNFKSS